jgi:hypothetical protein
VGSPFSIRIPVDFLNELYIICGIQRKKFACLLVSQTGIHWNPLESIGIPAMSFHGKQTKKVSIVSYRMFSNKPNRKEKNAS